MAMFDLPVMTDKERKQATRFRNDLIDHGFLIIQFSVYARPCVNFEQLSKHPGVIQKMVPEGKTPRSSYSITALFYPTHFRGKAKQAKCPGRHHGDC